MIYLRGIAIDSGDATAIYYSGRKSWHFPCNLRGPVAQDPEAIQELETLRRDGARYSRVPSRHSVVVVPVP